MDIQMSHDFGFVWEFSPLKWNYAILDVIVVNEQNHLVATEYSTARK
jgi:hypothetical protein